MKEKNINKLISSLSKQLGVSENQIKDAAQNGNVNDILKNADSNQTDKIKSVINDPEMTKEILNSPQAQALIKLLGGDDKN